MGSGRNQALGLNRLAESWTGWEKLSAGFKGKCWMDGVGVSRGQD